MLKLMIIFLPEIQGTPLEQMMELIKLRPRYKVRAGIME